MRVPYIRYLLHSLPQINSLFDSFSPFSAHFQAFIGTAPRIGHSGELSHVQADIKLFCSEMIAFYSGSHFKEIKAC
jgi:hypothetical protein